jgi:hypothetical protein
MAKVHGAPKKRRLGDLYQVGVDVVIDDGSGEEPIELYMRKPNPFEHEEALRDGNAARARMTLKMRDPKTDEYDILKADVEAIGNKRKQCEFLVGERTPEFTSRAYQRVSTRDEWSEDGLIDALQDNINEFADREDEMTEESEDWEDFLRVKEQVERFNKQVDNEVAIVREEEIENLLAEPDDEIRELTRKALIDKAASLLFFREYRLSCIYFATRESANHGQRYFTSKQEVRELPYEVQSLLLDRYESLDMTRDEVKNSPSAAPSSSESAQSNSPETSEPSGPESVSE